MNKVQLRVIFDRKKTATNKKAALVQIEVRHDDQRKFMSTGVKVFKNQFKGGRVCCHPDADLLNDKINTLYREIYELVNECDSKRINFRFELLERIRNGYQNTGMTFLQFIEKRIDEKPIVHSTKLQHWKVLRFLQNEWKLITYFSDLTLENVIKLDNYLKKRIVPGTGKPMCQTTVYTYHKVIRIYVNDAISMGLIAESPYDKYKTPKGRSKVRICLNMEEVMRFRNYTGPTAFRQKIADLFIVQCYTGLAYADLMRTDFTKLQKVGEDYVLTSETRLKSGTRFILFCLPPVMAILEKYEFKLPFLEYHVYNRHLKILGQKLGITKEVTTHIGRHTFATTIALGSGIPIEVVSKMLGHTNIQVTQIYAKILPERVIQAFQQIKQHVV